MSAGSWTNLQLPSPPRPLAQLVRADVLYTSGPRFESGKADMREQVMAAVARIVPEITAACKEKYGRCAPPDEVIETVTNLIVNWLPSFGAIKKVEGKPLENLGERVREFLTKDGAPYTLSEKQVAELAALGVSVNRVRMDASSVRAWNTDKYRYDPSDAKPLPDNSALGDVVKALQAAKTISPENLRSAVPFTVKGRKQNKYVIIKEDMTFECSNKPQEGDMTILGERLWPSLVALDDTKAFWKVGMCPTGRLLVITDGVTISAVSVLREKTHE